MPLDGHNYLTSYGWSGKGTGLRRGAIDKPIAIPKKRNLSGLGKDRDDAFPFWDHLYSAATKSITIKIADDDDDADQDEDNNEDTSPFKTLQLKRTTTGIISSRRPTLGTPASGTSTPDPDAYPRASIIAIAKRDTARKSLYSLFFRGPTLTPHDASNLPSLLPSSPLQSLEPTPERHIIPPQTTKRTSSELFERRERKRFNKEKKCKKAATAEKQKTTLHHLDERRTRKKAKRALKPSEEISPKNAELQNPVDHSQSQRQPQGTVDALPQVDDPTAGTQDDIDAKQRKKRDKRD